MFIYLIIIIGLIIIDQLSKVLIVIYMNEGQRISIIDRFFNLTSIRNTGAAWGNLKGQTSLLTIISVLSVILFSYFLFKEGNFTSRKVYTLSLIFIVAGAMGNLLDRIFRSSVVDFIDFYIFGYDFPVFNFADIFLTLGMIGFLLSMLILKE